jgi:hypothetical protein
LKCFSIFTEPCRPESNSRILARELLLADLQCWAAKVRWGASNIPDVVQCAEKERLWGAFKDVTQRFFALRDRQIQTAVVGEGDDKRFDALISAARDEKRLAKSAYLAHVRGHGC